MKLLAGAVLLALAGCSALHDSGAYLSAPEPRYVGGLPLRVASEHRHRYVCASGIQIVCECPARTARDCECRC
jgi:hypothetical protein